MKKSKKTVSKKTAKKSMTTKKTATKKTVAKKAAVKKTVKKPEPIVASGAVSSAENIVVVHPTEEPVASVLESVPAAAAKTRKIKR